MSEERRPTIFFDLSEMLLAGGTSDFRLQARCVFHGVEHGVSERLEFPLEGESLSKQMGYMREALYRKLDELL